MTIHRVEHAIKLESTSFYAPHSMLLPCNEIVSIGSDQLDTKILAWDLSEPFVGAMVTDLVAVLTPFFPDTFAFNLATLLEEDPDDQVLVPVFSWAIVGGGGDAIAGGWDKATQWTISFRSADNNVSKLELLDACSFDNWDKIVSLDGETALENLVNVWTSTGAGWSARDNTRPQTFVQATRTLNEKLRRAYRMT